MRKKRTEYIRKRIKSRKHILFAFILLWLALLPGVCLGATTNQISQFGITWTFDKEYQYGQFANGDYWVVNPDGGPVTVVDITKPNGVNGRDGSMVNPMPGDEHGYDDRVEVYRSSLDASLSLPLTLNPDESLISSISWGDSRPVLKTAAVLTVLGDIPPGGSFRPPYAGNEKPIYSTNNLKRELLLSLNPVANTPLLSSVERIFERPWIDHRLGWQGDKLHPGENMENYGAGIARDVGVGALRLLLNDSVENKETLLIRYIQLGIDNYGLVANGAHWGTVQGGIGIGRKYPIIFAGLMLNKDEIKNVGFDYEYRQSDSLRFGTFQEDCQTYYDHPDAPLNSFYGIEGFPRWGERYCDAWHPQHVDETWTYRFCCTSQANVGQTLAARLLGLEELWNHQAFFDYQDRWMIEDGDGGWGSAFADDMWFEYRDDIDTCSNNVWDRCAGNGTGNGCNEDKGLFEGETDVDFGGSCEAGGNLYGDINGNGEVTSYDAALVARYAVGLEVFTDEQRQRADVSGNGAVSAYDAALIAQRAVGLIDRFPVEE